jgi:hypothetical protein
MKMAAFWVTALCSLVEVDRRFRGAYCLHRQGGQTSIIARISETSGNFNESSQLCTQEGRHL